MKATSFLQVPSLRRAAERAAARLCAAPRSRCGVQAKRAGSRGVAVVGALAAFTACLLLFAPDARAQDCPALLAHTFPKLQDESPQNLCQYKGKVLLVVNTASYCGFTPQYEGLEKLYAQYAPKGLVVLGFPSGDFGNQEKTNNKDIAEFCFNTYGVKFPMFAKTSVRGDKANPLFAALANASGQPPKWNFHKYLIDRQGRVVKAFPSQVEPLDSRVTKEIEAALAAN